MACKINWKRVRDMSRDTEAAFPAQKPPPLRGGSHIKPGAVRRWADMTPEERQRIAETCQPPSGKAS